MNAPPPRVPARALRRVTALALFAAALAACATEAADGGLPEGPIAEVSQAVVTVGDWNGYGDGQCVIGAQTFYKNRFGVALKPTGVQSGNVGNCAWLGACMYWVSNAARPDPNVWNRYDFGTKMPQTYDLVIYPPTATNEYGHVASVDHMEGGDANNHTQLYVMDSNALVKEKKSPYIHTNSVRPYGFYRLKSREIPTCNEGCEGNVISRTNCEKTDCGPQGAVCIQEGGLRCDALPKGSFDVADDKTIRGWAFDPSNAGAPIDVHVYVGGPAGDPNAVGLPFKADRHRDDLCGAIGSCPHAFEWRTPRSFLDGQPRAMHVYGIDISGGHNAELGNSPRTLTAPPPAIPKTAILRKITSSSAFGAWKLSERDDVAPLPDDGAKFGEWKNQAQGVPDFPNAPEAVRGDDGSEQAWLVDSGVRRRVSPGAWRLDAIKTLRTPELMQIPVGSDFPASPEVVRDTGPTFYVLDVAFLPLSKGDPAPAPSTPGTGDPRPTKPAGTGTPKPGADPDDGGGTAPGTTTIQGGSNEADAGGCAFVGPTSRAEAGWAGALFATALAGLVRRRRRAA